MNLKINRSLKKAKKIEAMLNKRKSDVTPDEILDMRSVQTEPGCVKPSDRSLNKSQGMNADDNVKFVYDPKIQIIPIANDV